MIGFRRVTKRSPPQQLVQELLDLIIMGRVDEAEVYRLVIPFSREDPPHRLTRMPGVVFSRRVRSGSSDRILS